MRIKGLITKDKFLLVFQEPLTTTTVGQENLGPGHTREVLINYPLKENIICHHNTFSSATGVSQIF